MNQSEEKIILKKTMNLFLLGLIKEYLMVIKIYLDIVKTFKYILVYFIIYIETFIIIFYFVNFIKIKYIIVFFSIICCYCCNIDILYLNEKKKYFKF
jgi:hypothetical protein